MAARKNRAETAGLDPAEFDRRSRAWGCFLDEFDRRCIESPAIWNMFGPCRPRSQKEQEEIDNYVFKHKQPEQTSVADPLKDFLSAPVPKKPKKAVVEPPVAFSIVGKAHDGSDMLVRMRVGAPESPPVGASELRDHLERRAEKMNMMGANVRVIRETLDAEKREWVETDG